MLRNLAAGLLATALFSSCVPSTPQARIAANPTLFESLSPRHQQLVQQGQIDRGMPPAAVQLAWGRPSREYQGADAESSTLRWDYQGSQPVYSTNYAFAYGHGSRYGRYGRYGRRYPSYGYAVSPQVTYVPYHRASVWFRDQKVTRWERLRGTP